MRLCKSCHPIFLGIVSMSLVATGTSTPNQGGSAATATPVVCLDPGHPSEVNDGHAVQHGTTEVKMNWAVALELKALLQRRRVKVVMTKSSVNQLVTNKQRAQIANRSDANLMVRLHCDTGTTRGFTVYYPDRQGTKDGVTGPPQAVRSASGVAARILHQEMAKVLGGLLHDNGVKTDTQTLIGKRQGALTGSIYAQVPVVLVEMVFLSDAHDAAFIKSKAGQRKMAEALSDGIIECLSRLCRLSG